MRFLSRYPSPLTTLTKLYSTIQQEAQLHSHLKPQKSNTILKGYVKTSSTIKALLLFRSLWRKGTSCIDSFSLLLILKACTLKSHVGEGKQVHAMIINLGFESVIFLQTTLLNMYSAMGNLDDAHRLFDEIPSKNVVCWTALISAYVNNGKPNKALKIFRQMQVDNVEPDQVTVTVALSACADLGALDMGEWIHAYVCRYQGVEADLCLNNALINMYAKCGDIRKARRLFDRVKQKDVATWTSMIVGHALHGQTEEALQLFEKMEESNRCRNRNRNNSDQRSNLVLPNQVTFIGVLMACSHAGLVEEGRQYLKSMKENYGLTPQISHHGCIVDLLCRAGLLEEAYGFIMNMPIQASVVVWRTLLSASSLHGNIELAANIHHRLRELEPNHAGDDVTMSNTYAAAGMWNNKLTVRDQMMQRRPPGSSSIEVGSTVHEFVAADKSHPLRRDIYATIEGMNKNIKAFGYTPDISW
ncbi:putative pentatricopeptide repeat-containing protein At1g74400 [Telopea speciosissima]|uniref:putative pentatricopeptide repeat-containing protein At1g74400 n=1 Tax=Telopea speciosissima TaxID=54955 RepID=UPI001CC796D7|nr:putative pentatricopeptide repeat-containing protein At1g74400 [Telopea speciosissima]